MLRFIRVIVSFAIVLSAYLAYTAVAVPWIEPTVERPDPAAPIHGSVGQSSRQHDRLCEILAEFLHETGRSLKKAKFLASRQYHLQLIFWDYDTLPGGQVRFRPCVIIYTPEETPSPLKASMRGAIVLEIPDGAMLEFDEPLSLNRMTTGRLQKGYLSGRITIRSEGKRPGPEDDLLIVAHDVTLTEKLVESTHPVWFRFGANHGSGQHMSIKLLSGELSGRKPAPPVGIELFEIRRLDQLHLEFSDTLLALNGAGKPSSSPPLSPIGMDQPLEISCRGPFRFNPIRQTVTFEDAVNVMQINPDGPSDQIHCNVLSLYLARSRDAVKSLVPLNISQTKDKASRRNKIAWDLQPRRIEARGNPVVVAAHSRGVHVHGNRLDYDFQTRRIELDNSEEVFLQQGENQIHTQSLQYTPGLNGSLGEVEAKGPGRLTGRPPGGAHEFQATWSEQLKIRPIDGQQVVSLLGRTEFDYGGVVDAAADEINLWFRESQLPVARPDSSKKFEPSYMEATGNVCLRSAKFSGEIDQLEIWFDPAEGSAEEEVQRPSLEGGAPSNNLSLNNSSSNNSPLLDASESEQHFSLVGKLLHGRMRLCNRKPELTALIIEGGVQLTETHTAQPDEQPVVISGSRLRMTDASQPHATVAITGAPAHFEGRGLELTSANINLDRGDNRLWVQGPGQMSLPLRHDFQGKSLSTPSSMAIHWRQGMTFDGRTVVFDGLVVAATEHQEIRADMLEVEFKKTIRFDQLSQANSLSNGSLQPNSLSNGSETTPMPERIRCRGNVSFQSKSFEDREQISVETMRMMDLEIFLASGQTLATGPGWMTTVRRNSDDLPGMGSGGLFGFGTQASDDPRGAENNAAADPNQLVYLGIGFHGSIKGNFHDREMTFHDQVQTAYGHVPTWDVPFESVTLDSLGPRGMLLDCQKLTVTQMPSLRKDQPVVEFEASGGMAVESQKFTAQAERMTYTAAKKLLLLEGNGRTDVRVSYQPNPGAPYIPGAAQKIWIWLEPFKVAFNDTKSIEFLLPSSPSKRTQ